MDTWSGGTVSRKSLLQPQHFLPFPEIVPFPLSAMLNSQASYRFTLVPRLPFLVPRPPLPVLLTCFWKPKYFWTQCWQDIVFLRFVNRFLANYLRNHRMKKFSGVIFQRSLKLHELAHKSYWPKIIERAIAWLRKQSWYLPPGSVNAVLLLVNSHFFLRFDKQLPL